MLFLAALTLVSNLQWHTDLEEAKRAALREGKPILSLRLLGNLDEELSCANSRFYRTIVYTDPHVAQYLREHFILHWQSVRPAPKITIDFGDGRKITTTITGNSIHYILAPDGHVIDAIPGLYTPQAFLAALQSSSLSPPSGERVREAGVRGNPTAIAASKLTGSKNVVERSTLNALTLYQDHSLMIFERADDVELSDESIAAIRAHTRPRRDEQFAEMISLLKSTLAADTKINETQLRPAIRAWIASGITNVDQLNEKVYSELFLTGNDPWLGLLPNAYNGLENDGVTTSSTVPVDKSARRLSHAPAESSRSRR